LLLVGFILFIAWLAKTPVRIGHAHNTKPTGGPVSTASALGLILNRVLARAFSTHGVGCSAEAGTALFGRGLQEDSKYELLHCGIDLTPFESANSLDTQRTTLGLRPGAKVIGHVGSFSVAKNHRFLLAVAAHVFRLREDVTLLLVGDGALRPSIEQSCGDSGIRSRVIFAGVSSCVPELMRSAMDVFVMPSLHEGLPLALLEAQAAGLPCLVSDVVSREALVSDGAVHLLPLASGPAAWGDAVLSLLERPSRQSELLAQMARTDHNIVVSVERLKDLYAAALGASGAPRQILQSTR
jgi:glycosyltransferase involved in cell wall biosynthesis